MGTIEGLPGFNYTPFTREDLIRNMLALKESGKCFVKNPKFYEPWDMIEYGTEEWEQEMKKPKIRTD